MSTILIVDDCEADRRLLQTVLGPKGYTLVEAQNAEQALRILSKRRPDLVIVDIYMPGKSGLQLVAQMHEDPALSAIPVMFYTSWHDEPNVHDAIRAYGYTVLAKPISIRAIAAIIEKSLPLEESATIS